jgi:hypothetical protein
MIDGLKLTMTGEELRGRLQERVERHRRIVAHYEHEATREPDPKVEYDYVMPQQMCEYEQELHGWRSEVLEYIRDHIERGEIYRLAAADLAFGEILPEMPGSVEQEKYEREERIGFSMERIAKKIGSSGFGMHALADAIAEHGQLSLDRCAREPGADAAVGQEEVEHAS